MRSEITNPNHALCGVRDKVGILLEQWHWGFMHLVEGLLLDVGDYAIYPCLLDLLTVLCSENTLNKQATNNQSTHKPQ